MTLDAGGNVAVRAVTADGPALSRDHWEAQPGWYNPARHQANFMVLSSADPGATPASWMARVRATFGQPARVFYVGQYTILIWNKNLLADLRQ